MRWINALWRRRVPQTLGIFLGAVWGLLEMASFIVERYRLTDNIVDMVALGALLLLPTAMIWALRQRPDPDDLVDGRDVLVGGCNLVLAAAVVFVSFGGQAIGRTTDTVLVENESGALEAREVPRQDMVRSVSITPFKRGNVETIAWLGLAVGLTMQLDLSQDRFILVQSGAPFGTVGDGDPGDLSVARRQSIARRTNSQYFVAGEVMGTLGQVEIDVALYRTDPLQVVASFSSQGQNLTDTVDALSPQIRAAMELSAQRSAAAVDAPVRTLLSDVDDALRSYFSGEYLIASENDLKGGMAELRQALALDSGFAFAALRLYYYSANTGNTADLQRSLGIAHEYRERLTEETRCLVRTYQASLNRQTDQMMRIARGCVEQFPGSVMVRSVYAEYLRAWGSDLEGAIAQYEAILALGSANDSALLTIARLRERSGDSEGAMAAYQHYLNLKPTDPTAIIGLADLEIRTGRRAEARERLLDGLALQDRVDTTLISTLASMYLREGDFAGSAKTVEGLRSSEDRLQKLAALQALQQIAEARGRMVEALELNTQIRALYPTGFEARAELDQASRYAELGLPEGGFAGFDRLILAAVPGDDKVAEASRELLRLRLALRVGAADDVERGLLALRQFIQDYGRQDLQHVALAAEARLAVLEGRGADALLLYPKAYAALRRDGDASVISEVPLLRNWLEAATAAADAEAGSEPYRWLQRLQPGYPLSLLARAEFDAATGNASGARALLNQALTDWSEADAGHPYLSRAQQLCQRLRGTLAADPSPDTSSRAPSKPAACT